MLINIAASKRRKQSNYIFIYCMLAHICVKGYRNQYKKQYAIQWAGSQLTEHGSVLLCELLKLSKKPAMT